MTFKEYMTHTADTAIYSRDNMIEINGYLFSHFAAEMWEVNSAIADCSIIHAEFLNSKGDGKTQNAYVSDFITAREKLAKELGDVCWFVSQIMNENNFTPDARYFPQTERLDSMFGGIVSTFPGPVAKTLRDKRGNFVSEYRKTIDNVLRNTLTYIVSIADYYEISFESILQGNVDKLQKRKQSDTISGDGDNR